MSGQSALSSIFRQLANGNTNTSSTKANTSWYMGSNKAAVVPSYITVLKAPKGSSSSNAASVVASKLGVDIKNPENNKKKKHHSSLFGEILGGTKDVAGNLVSDVIDTAESTPAGLLKIATTNPVDTAKAIGEDYKMRYGKLFSGDFGGFAHDVASHPFGYLLDASSLGTGGGAILGRLAPSLAKGGEVALRVDKAASKAGEVSNITKQLSRNPFTRNVFEKPAYALQRTLPNVPVVGEKATAIRHITSQVESKVGQLGHAQQSFEKAVREVRNKTKKDDTLLQAFDRVSADLRHRPLQTFGQGLHTPKARAFDSKLDTNLSLETRHSPEIDALHNQIKSEISLDARGNLVAKEGASAATHSFLKIHNARESLNQSVVKLEEQVAKTNPQKVATKVASSSRYVESIKNPEVNVGGKFSAAKGDVNLPNRPNPNYRGATAHYGTGATEHTIKGTHKVEYTADTESPTLPFTPLEIQRYSQVPYSPHQQFPNPRPNPNYRPGGMKVTSTGDRTVVTPGTADKFTAAKGSPRLAQEANPDYKPATASYGTGKATVSSGVELKAGSALGKKAQRTAQQVAPKTKTYLDGVRTVDAHSDPVANYLEMHNKGIRAAGGAISRNFLDMYGNDPSLTRELTSIFDRHSAAGSLSGNFNKATQVWKDLILVGRPAFLVNNYVGNQAMYHLKQGIGGMALQKAAKGELNKAFENHFFEHRQSLGSSERAAPRIDKLGNELEPSRYRKATGAVYGAQSRHEQVLRKATMREAAMSIPAIKTEVRKLIGEKKLSEGEALNQAMTKAFKDNPGYRELISKAIDDTMGNYRHYNQFEKGLKQIVPFYGWNRHALRTYTSIIKDQPLEAAALSEIGMQGKKDNAKMFPGTPDFMKTYVTGKLGTFDTQSLNPLKGGSDTVKSIKELINGNPGNMPAIASNLNPFISGGAQALSGVNLTTGAPVTSAGGLLGSILGQTTGGLPQVKIGKLALGMNDTGNRKDPHYFLTPTGQLKRKFKDSEGKILFGDDGLPLEAADRHMLKPSLENSVLSWLGAPKRDVNLKTAQVIAKSINSKLHPATDFHKRKTKKKTVKHVVNLVNTYTSGG